MNIHQRAGQMARRDLELTTALVKVLRLREAQEYGTFRSRCNRVYHHISEHREWLRIRKEKVAA